MISTEQASDILNRDGSCRDLNTNDLSFAEIGILIQNMNALYTLISAEDAEGIEIQDTLRNFQSVGKASFKGFHSRWQASEQLIREL